MRIHVGFEMIYDCPQPTPMIFNLNVHVTRVSDLVGRDDLVVDPPVPMAAYRDGFGNWCTRIVAPQGRTRVMANALVNDTGLPDVIVPEAQQIPVPDLPEDTLVFLLGSRYCETDRLSETAWNLFGQTPTGWGLPALASAFLGVAQTGGLEGALTSAGNFYGGDATRSLLLLSDGAYLEDQARAKNLGGDQWGMMNEAGNAPGQPWMWLYTFWYQVPPFSTSDNADALVWGTMMFLTLLLIFVPFLPGLRSIPRLIPIHRLVWRDYYRNAKKS